jgi:hypothetical protein
VFSNRPTLSIHRFARLGATARSIAAEEVHRFARLGPPGAGALTGRVSRYAAGMGRRRLVFTAPLVITLFAGCEQNPPGRTMNPPDPEPTPNPPEPPMLPIDAGQVTAVAVDAGAAKPELERVVTTGHLIKDAKGLCQWAPTSSCSPLADCNPPRPVRIECPDPARQGSLPEAPPGSWVTATDQGICMLEPPFDASQCPPDVPCNPPVPTEVRCPTVE